jgi:hypothetical protein
MRVATTWSQEQAGGVEAAQYLHSVHTHAHTYLEARVLHHIELDRLQLAARCGGGGRGGTPCTCRRSARQDVTRAQAPRARGRCKRGGLTSRRASAIDCVGARHFELRGRLQAATLVTSSLGTCEATWLGRRRSRACSGPASTSTARAGCGLRGTRHYSTSTAFIETEISKKDSLPPIATQGPSSIKLSGLCGTTQPIYKPAVQP